MILLLNCTLLAYAVNKRSPLEHGSASLFNLPSHLPKDNVERAQIKASLDKTEGKNSYVWVPGHVYHHAFIPGHLHHVFVPRVVVARTLFLNRENGEHLYGGFGVGSSVGGQGAGHGYQIVFNNI